MFTLITGASSGIGADLAVQLAQKGINLILTGRNIAALNSIASNCRNIGVLCHTIAADLSVINAGTLLFEEASKMGAIDCLINNAGIGYVGTFSNQTLSNVQAMINTNMMALTELCYAASHSMKLRKTGKIINIASTASFIPGPFMAVYFASKAYVLSLSLALEAELKDEGIKVFTYCPGPTQSNFAHTAGFLVDDSKLTPLPTAQQVAADIIKAYSTHNHLAIHGFKNKWQIFKQRFQTHRGLAKSVYKNLKPSSNKP